MESNLSTIDQSYVPAHLAIEAMRDNGYKNTAYAVAELIDNSIQAEANYVQLMCEETDILLNQRTISKLNQLAVLDNGLGMTKDVLRMSLQFGNGTRLQKNQRTGIGRFGMGLPASSISQCTRVDVWSWQNGIESAQHVFLDIEDIKTRKTHEIPQAVQSSIPNIWLEKGDQFGETGTLVVWSNLDRLMWSKGQTLVKHSELLIGRMYRKFLNEDKLKIDFTIFNLDRKHEEQSKQFALPNDPMYLMKKTSCPDPFKEQAMFEPFGGIENYETKFDVNYAGKTHEVFIRLSIAKDEARSDQNGNPGSQPYGKHAKENVGISIIRSGRELELDQSVVNQHETTERWWGIEVEFPPTLDELMGVTNNKQTARNFSDILNMMDEVEKIQKSGKTIDDLMEELIEEGDPRAPLIKVCDFINKKLSLLRKAVKNQTVGSKSDRRYEVNRKVEIKATDTTKKRQEEGYEGGSDSDESKPVEQRHQEIREGLIEIGVDQESATTVADEVISHNLKFSFIEQAFEGNAFFAVRPNGGNISILLNKAHPAYECLLEVLDKENEDQSIAALKLRLKKASEGLKLLFAAWARYEDETPDGKRRDDIQNVRQDWGKFAKYYLRNEQ